MGPYLALTLMASGGCGVAGGFFARLWWHARRERLLLRFACVCAASAAHCLILAVLATSASVATAQLALDLRTDSGALLMVLLAWLINGVTGLRARWFVAAVAAVAAAMVLANTLILPLNGVVARLEPIPLPWREPVWAPVRAGAAGWWVLPIYVAICTIGVHALVGARTLAARDRLAGALVALAGVNLLGSSALSAAVDAFALRGPYLGAAVFLVWLAVMGAFVAREHRRRSERLLATEHRLAGFFIASPLPVLVARVDDGEVVAANPACERTFGWSAAAVGRAVDAVGLCADASAWRALCARVRANGLADVELEVRRGDAALRRAVATCALVDVDGVACVQAAIADVTERRESEESQRRGERLASVGSLASGVAHDVNNGLAVILGNAELLLSDAATPRAAEAARRVVVASQQIAGTTAALLRFARHGSEAPEEYVALEAVRAAVDLFACGARGVSVELSAEAGEGVRVRGRRVDLQNAALNLLLNARDAMRGSGTIRVALTAQTLDADACARRVPYRVRPGRCLVLIVADDGAGMDEAVRRRCFVPFFTTKGDAGTGLGLASVHHAVIEHGGAVAVASEPGRGTTFTLWLPACGGGATMA